jgi:hypothetical protein
MAACLDLRDIASSFDKATPGKRYVKKMDHLKCAGYWAGTIVTLGTLPKFSKTAREFKVRYDVSKSCVQDSARQKLVRDYCDRLKVVSEAELKSVESDISTLLESINEIPQENVIPHLKEMLIKQLVVKQLAADKLKDEISKCEYICLTLSTLSGVAYSEFLKLTHMDVNFIETMELMRSAKHISDAHQSENMLKESRSLGYMGGCGHDHAHHGHQCSHHHHEDHAKAPSIREVTYNLQDAVSTDESDQYLSAFDYVVKTHLAKQMDEQWVKRGNHLETMIYAGHLK